MSYYGGMPVGQLKQPDSSQDKIEQRRYRGREAYSLQSSISAVNDLTSLAAASAESPFYKWTRRPLPARAAKWNGFVSKYGQASMTGSRTTAANPTNMQKRENCPGILFPMVCRAATSTEIHDLTNKLRLDDAGKPISPEGTQSRVLARIKMNQ